MWEKISHLILRNRWTFLIIMLLITGFMGWVAYERLELSYRYARVLPADDPAHYAYEDFKKKYGEDGTVLVIALQDSSLFQLGKFNGLYDLTDSLKNIKTYSDSCNCYINAIKQVLSLTRLYDLKYTDSTGKYEFLPVVQRRPESQEETDSLKKVIYSMPFYEGLAFKKKDHISVIAITFYENALNSKDRIPIVNKITSLTDAFVAKHKIAEVHYSGMPYIRAEYMRRISSETTFFMYLALIVTAIILWLFFRYFNAVFFSLIVVVIGVIWSVGTMGLFDYKITVLTGLIPPLIIVIGLPNCIFLLNKYQEELRKHGNKMKALARMVQKVGLSNFLANVTTAIGFGVFKFTNSEMLEQFGVIAAINVMTTYIIALILIPIFFSWLPEPKARHTKHLSGKRINWLVELVDRLVHHHRRGIYLFIGIISAISFVGMYFINVNGYVVDDLPTKDRIYTDLHYFEKNFGGVLPFEVAIKSKNPKGIFDKNDEGEALYLIDSMQNLVKNVMVDSVPIFSRPISIVEAAKFANQARLTAEKGKRSAKFYFLPGDRASLMELAGNNDSMLSKQEQKLSTFITKDKKETRVSFQMADIGSRKSKVILADLKPRIDSIFPADKYTVDMTGHSLMFLKSNDYLLHHLFVSLAIAIGLILLIGMALFRSIAIIVLSKAPCLIPLLITAGAMGFFNIPIKPSTILIFSIAFGIASDGTIYILTEYRHQLNKLSAGNAAKAVSNTIREVGLSMIYTNVILFAGFIIFSLSSFGGTVALGVLISITLLMSLATNLILLPCILLSLEKRSVIKAFRKEPLINIYDEEEDIDSDKLIIQAAGENHDDE
ncbi:MAG: hypothetical protein FD123_1115 [Bacteroidetes bacterium]|nr:MAG: hypothetical protein FD123_1115 [Bacteroidota bacterium]